MNGFKDNYPINAFTCASTFYGLEALKVAVQFNSQKPFDSFLKSNVMLLKDINDYQQIIVKKLSHMLYDYSAIACYGELRHCASTSHARYKGAGFPKRSEGGRNDAYMKALNYKPEDILSLSVEAFDPSNKWDSSYGGAKWQMIAKHALRYGKIDNLIFCDTAFSLSHNCSPFLNKSESRIFYISCSDTYKSLLDIKFSLTPNEILEYIVDESCELDRTFVKLVHRCINLGFVQMHAMTKHNMLVKKNKINLLDEIKRNYHPLVWSQKRMTATKMMKWCKTITEQKFYDQLHIGMNCKIMDNAYIRYYPLEKNIERNPILKEMFPYGSHNYTVERLINEIGFSNSFETMKIANIDGGDLTIELTNGDKIFTTFQNVIGLNNKYKAVQLKKIKK